MTAKGVLSDSHRWSIGIYRGAFPEVGRAVEDSDCPPRPIVLLPASNDGSVNANQGYSFIRLRMGSLSSAQVINFGLSPHVIFISCAPISLAVVSRLLA